MQMLNSTHKRSQKLRSLIPPLLEMNLQNRRQIKHNTFLFSLKSPRTQRIPSFNIETPHLPKRQRRKSFSDGACGSKLSRLDCYYPKFLCAQHQALQLKESNQLAAKEHVQKAIKHAQIIASTVRYWKSRSTVHLDLTNLRKSIHLPRQSYHCERESITTRQPRKSIVLLSQFKIRINEKLQQYSRERTQDKTQQNLPFLSQINSRFSIQKNKQ